jgi:hypothetical protein
MANVVRTAKSGDRWGPYELIAFNINVVSEDIGAFFGNADLPQLTVSSAILNNLEKPTGPLLKSDKNFFAYLEDAMTMIPDKEDSGYVADFVTFILEMMHYDEGRRVIHPRKEIGFEMCGERVKAIPDVCVLERFGEYFQYLLLVQEDKVCELTFAH